MKKGKFINITLVLGIFLLLGIFALFVRIRPMADRVAVVKAEGIDCGEATADIEKVLQLRKGVSAVEINTNDGWVVVGYDSNAIHPESIAASITALGYTVRAAETLSMEQFHAMTGRELGVSSDSAGCGGLCGVSR